MTQPPALGQLATPQARMHPMPTGGRWGWYRDHEGNEHRRVSGLLKFAETDKYHLDLWMKRQVAEGLAIRDDLVLAIKAMGRPDPVIGWSSADKRKIDGIAKDAMQAAKQVDGARRGTAYHDLTERLDRGEPLDSVTRGLPAGVANMVAAYDFLRREHGWQNVEIERTVVCEELEVAGTLDRVDYIPGLLAMLGPSPCQFGDGCPDAGLHGGDLPVVADVKSESAPWLNGLHIAPQLAIYSRSRKMWRPTGGMVKVRFSKDGDPVDVPAGEYVPARCVRQDVGVVVHTTETGAVPYFVDLAEGWDTAQAAYRQMKREGRAKTRVGEPGAWFVEVPGIQRPRAHAPVAADIAAQHAANRGGQRCLVCHSDVDPGQENCRKCGNRVSLPAAEESYRRADGMVDWRPVGSVPAENTLAAATEADGSRPGALDDVDRQAIDAIWAARELSDLAKTFEIYTVTIGRTWAGRVAEAGAARQAQIACVQRELHTGGGKCACGWDPRFPV